MERVLYILALEPLLAVLYRSPTQWSKTLVWCLTRKLPAVKLFASKYLNTLPLLNLHLLPQCMYLNVYALSPSSDSS